MIDIHSHLLPAVDDGPESIESSKEILELYYSIGFEKVVATPHFYPSLYEKSNMEVEESFKLLVSSVENNCLVEFTREYYTDFVLLENLSDKNFIKPYPDGKHILIEFSFSIPPVNWKSVIFSIQSEGFEPILAHPERYLWLKDNKKFITEFKDRGGLLQGNMGSLTGMYGNYAKKMSSVMMKDRLYDFLATDTHKYGQLEVLGKKVIPKLIKKYGEVFFFLLTKDNPQKLLG